MILLWFHPPAFLYSQLQGLRPRQLAFQTLKSVEQGAFADVALHRTLARNSLGDSDRRLVTELVYGVVRRQRTLDALIDQFARKSQQATDLRLALRLGLYQLRYLQQIPPSAAVNTTVALLKQNRLGGLAGVANGLLRGYLRASEKSDPLSVSNFDPVTALGIQQSYPDWIVQLWVDELGIEAAAQLCDVLNQAPAIHLRVNPLKTTVAAVETAFRQAGLETQPISGLPNALLLPKQVGAIPALPGFAEGWWSVQDASAQLVSHFLGPTPGTTVLDLCAAPGGKTLHCAELMQGQGTIWACDRTASRLRKLAQSQQRLGVDQCIQTRAVDGRQLSTDIPMVDYALVDAPCSGLGTLHRHADARWRQTPDSVKGLVQLQRELLSTAAAKVKPGGVLVYATCTLNPAENQDVVQRFLQQHPAWQLTPCETSIPLIEKQAQLTLWPHERAMDGFFMARFVRR